MKRNLLQRRALTAALFVLLLSVVGSKNAFAQTQVATLQHGDDISVFYGANAFEEAHDAAQTGDIITLSSGTFVPTAITKAITLRGAGCAIDTAAHTNPTIFGGDIYLDVADTANFLTIEGILFTNQVLYYTLYNPKFNRCNFTSFLYSSYSSGSEMNNAQFVNCIIDDLSLVYANNTTVINSVVWLPNGMYNSNTLVLYNSISGPANINWSGASSPLNGVSAFNSVIIRDNKTNGPYSYGSGSTFLNCIGIQLGDYAPFGDAYTSGCISYNSYEEVFEDFIGDFSFNETYFLKDEIITGFLGDDGTQVGIYGGLLPYSNRPSYMLLKRCNVANKSTIDGKLSVDIEVVTEE